MTEDRQTMHIYIHNLTHAQAIAIEDMLAIWQQGGSMGCSRWTAFFADGDGNFRPACIVNGHVARHQKLVPAERFWTNKEPWRGDYRIDFDVIAWALMRHEKEVAALSSGATASDEAASSPKGTK